MTQFLCIIVCLFVSSYIVFSKGCILLSTGGCARGRIAFGGRLVLVGNDGAGVGDISRPLIFVTPFAFNSHRKLPLGFGRGQIWIGKRNCLGQSPQSHNNCPVDESRPCLDSTAPCFSAPPTFTQSEPLQFSNITETSLTVSWPAWNETTDLGVGPVTQYKLQYREEGAVFNDVLLDSCTLQYQFEGLKSGRTYEFRITLIRDLPYIESQPSNVQKETTIEAPGYKQDYPLSFFDVTNSSITVTWPKWDKTTGTGTDPVKEYRIQYREQIPEQGPDENFRNIVENTVLSHKIDGLKEGTTYEFRIILVSETSTGTPSLIQMQMTPCGDLNDSTFVLNTTSKVMGKSRIIANWEIRELLGSCEVSQQVIKIHQLDDGGCSLSSPSDTKVERLPSDKRKKTFSKLTPNSNFNITLTVTHPSGVYTFSKIQRSAGTDSEEQPKVTLQQIGKFYLLRWDEPPCNRRDGENIWYGVSTTTLRGEGKEEHSYYRTKNTRVLYNMKDFKAGDQLTVKVQAWTKKRPGLFSKPVTLTF